MLSRILLLVTLLTSVVSARPAAAQLAAPDGPRLDRRTWFETTPAGTFRREAFAPAGATLFPSSVPTGLQWTWPDGGAGWIPEYVAFGDRGAQVFSHHYLNHTAAALASSFDGDPPQPVWALDTDPAQPGMADGAELADVFASITATETGTINQRVVEVRKFSSSSPAPDWVYTYPQLTAGRLAVAVTRDGRFVVAMISKPGTDGHYDLFAFDAQSGALLTQTEVPQSGAGGALWGFDAARDARLVAFTLGQRAFVYDWAAQQELFELTDPESFSLKGVGISADGAVLALGGVFGNGEVRVFERVLPTGWTLTWAHQGPVGGLASVVQVSDDGSTIAAGYGFPYPSTVVYVQALDVPSKTLLMSDVHSSFGQYQNYVADIELTPDGGTIAVGEFGDEPGLVPELRVYARDQDVPLHTVDLPGSVFAVDVSEDGEWVLAGSKAVHANELGHGGRIDLFRVGGADLDVEGAPRAGATVDLVLHGTPGSPAFLLLAPAGAAPPIDYPGVGTLHLDRAALTIQALGAVGPDGTARLSLAIPAGPLLVGTELWAQGLTYPGRTLTASFRKLTVLP